MNDRRQWAVVLGAGGHAASAWEVGVLAGLADGGVDVRGADLFVGTSAGARVAIQVLTAASLEQLLDAEVDPRRPNEERLPPGFDREAWRAACARARRAPRVEEVLRRLGQLEPAAPAYDERLEAIATLIATRQWPQQRVLLAAVDAETGERVAFDRTGGEDLLDAVLASGAVPGIWPLPVIRGRRYMDGGTYSMTNVDLASGCDRILLLTLKPGATMMSAVSLEDGLSKVQREGARVDVVVPTEAADAALALVGHDVLDPAIRQTVARQGRTQGRDLALRLDWSSMNGRHEPRTPRREGGDRYPSILARILARQGRPHEDILDEVYERFAHSNPFLPVTHFVDHATMGSEALVGLGLGGRVAEWVSRHRPRAYKPPSEGVPIATAWEAAVGRGECHGDWLMQLERELRVDRYQDVLARWVPRLSYDVGALLFHGVIRTGHAVRALDQRDTPARRGELARGLALWAIGVRRPPAAPWAGHAELGAVETQIAQLARAGAAAFIRNPSIPNVHLLTGPMAYLLMAHHLYPSVHKLALASYRDTHEEALASFAQAEPVARAAPTPRLDDAQLVRLARQRDAHPAKLTEAALRAYDLTGDDLFLKAAGRMQDSSALGRTWRTARSAVMGRIP